MSARPARLVPVVVGVLVVALVAAVVVTVVAGRALVDAVDELVGDADPPAARGAAGAWVADADDPLSYRVGDSSCEPDGGVERCRVEVGLRNDGDDPVLVRERMVAGVVDGAYVGVTTAPGGLPTELEPDRTQALEVEVVVLDGERLEAVAFDAVDARSDESTVVALR